MGTKHLHCKGIASFFHSSANSEASAILLIILRSMASGQKREQVSLRVKSTASLHGGPFFTTNCLSQVKQICKPHSLRANLIVSAEIHSFLWRRASRLKAQHLSWQPLHFYVYHSYFLDFPEGVGKHLPYICLAKTPVLSQKDGRILPKGKENPGNTQECRNACVSPDFGFIFTLVLSVTLGTWDWTLSFDSPYHFSHPRKPVG